MTTYRRRKQLLCITLLPDKQNKLPWRLVIDIYNEGRAGCVGTDLASRHTIVIDPGHGGSGTGAVGETAFGKRLHFLSTASRTSEESSANVVDGLGRMIGRLRSERHGCRNYVSRWAKPAKADSSIHLLATRLRSRRRMDGDVFTIPRPGRRRRWQQAAGRMIDHGGRRNRYQRGTIR